MYQTWRGTLAAAWILSLAVLAGTGRQAGAQVPNNAHAIKKHYTNKPVFHLPVKVEERFRENLREMVLFVKGPQGDWAKQATLPPSGDHFTYRVPQDGEYWFTVVMIDRAGVASPPDVNMVPPGLRVVVDMQPPQLELRPWTSPEGEIFFKCLVLDANPDLASVRLVCRTDAGEKTVEPVPNLPGLIRFTPDMLAASVRLTAADLCGNQASMDVNLNHLLSGTLPAANLQAAKAPGTAPSLAPPAIGQPNDGAHPTNNITTTSARMEPRAAASGTLITDTNNPGAGNGKNDFPSSPPTSPALTNDTGLPPAPVLSAPPGTSNENTVAPGTNVANAAVPPTTTSQPPADSLPAIPPLPSGGVLQQNVQPTAPASSGTVVGNRQLLNVPQATVEYRIDQVGPSGVGKVEVYITGDQGNTWQRLKEDTDRRSPANIELPGEGLFGIRLAVTNGNGFGGTPPQRGDTPTYWIEVDTTCPFVQLRPIDASAASGALDIRWTASDKNLGPEPVSLYFRIRPDAAWQVIARNLKNDGQYRWNFPRGAGSQFFLKVEVADQAGNIARAETPNAIVLDMTEPRASVVSVTGGTSRPLNTTQGN